MASEPNMYDERDNDGLKRRVLQLTHASNAYLGELLYGKNQSVWEETRAHLVDTAVEVMRAMGITNEEVTQVIAEQVDFEE